MSASVFDCLGGCGRRTANLTGTCLSCQSKPLRRRVVMLLGTLGAFHGEEYAETAAQIARRLRVKLSTISSLLKKLVDAGSLRRSRGVGPRGGYGYRGYLMRP